jgi:hypothetical protein
VEGKRRRGDPRAFSLTTSPGTRERLPFAREDVVEFRTALAERLTGSTRHARPSPRTIVSPPCGRRRPTTWNGTASRCTASSVAASSSCGTSAPRSRRSPDRRPVWDRGERAAKYCGNAGSRCSERASPHSVDSRTRPSLALPCRSMAARHRHDPHGSNSVPSWDAASSGRRRQAAAR